MMPANELIGLFSIAHIVFIWKKCLEGASSDLGQQHEALCEPRASGKRGPSIFPLLRSGVHTCTHV